jgi:hypothetical protein
LWKGLRMSSVPDPAIAEKKTWSRATMIVVRLALLVFLVWALVSARFPENSPVAEDSAAPGQNSHSVSEPCPAPPNQLG